jgi:hypothetical protein
MEMALKSSGAPKFTFDKKKEYNLVQSLFLEFKKFDHQDIFMFIMDTRDELLQSRNKFDKLEHEHSQVRTELIMLKKFHNDRTVKHSKERFEKMEKEFDVVKKEAEYLRQHSGSLKQEVKNLTKSLLQSNDVITTVLTEIQNGSESSMISLTNLIRALETKISLLISKSNMNSIHSYSKETDYGKFDPDSLMILNNVEEIASDSQMKNALQDTQVFLKQAMDTLK